MSEPLIKLIFMIATDNKKLCVIILITVKSVISYGDDTV